jgi:hypothetical protein
VGMAGTRMEASIEVKVGKPMRRLLDWPHLWRAGCAEVLLERLLWLFPLQSDLASLYMLPE